ncbi:MAG TPA: DUF1924 domain-containing protein [Ferrovibrio sp.]|uniref:DUF1924 domain-containing protein n=1 Tax=Ferrovibrio sp. TaxID=1917215 RepID=UPI002ED1C228
MTLPRIALAAVAAIAIPLAAMAADADRSAILKRYADLARAADSGFAGFSAARGETLYRTTWAGSDARTPSCMSCHTSDPKQPGRNAKTGRPIDPAAVSVNPQRYTDLTEVEKHFARDCKSVLGRDCTPQERGDYLTFMIGQ